MCLERVYTRPIAIIDGDDVRYRTRTIEEKVCKIAFGTLFAAASVLSAIGFVLTGHPALLCASVLFGVCSCYIYTSDGKTYVRRAQQAAYAPAPSVIVVNPAPAPLPRPASPWSFSRWFGSSSSMPRPAVAVPTYVAPSRPVPHPASPVPTYAQPAPAANRYSPPPPSAQEAQRRAPIGQHPLPSAGYASPQPTVITAAPVFEEQRRAPVGQRAPDHHQTPSAPSMSAAAAQQRAPIGSRLPELQPDPQVTGSGATARGAIGRQK